ncbi:hypothetical protein AJ80_00193 [Polytolypa hystricis UAMH7299]|uniref:Uncharacterized protein n=1 Tax=Polytolypa hystricis (strain UAMH7299) TaxID=1447883 RepID=A0A2B7Z3X1_POLH7|nr:hypothetical protein AJ80_00193 [Polytolypa hystricis UAMH7299]
MSWSRTPVEIRLLILEILADPDNYMSFKEREEYYCDQCARSIDEYFENGGCYLCAGDPDEDPDDYDYCDDCAEHYNQEPKEEFDGEFGALVLETILQSAALETVQIEYVLYYLEDDDAIEVLKRGIAKVKISTSDSSDVQWPYLGPWLCAAVGGKCLGCVELLLQAGAGLDFDCGTPVFIMFQQRSIELLDFFSKYNASLDWGSFEEAREAFSRGLCYY